MLLQICGSLCSHEASSALDVLPETLMQLKREVQYTWHHTLHGPGGFSYHHSPCLVQELGIQQHAGALACLQDIMLWRTAMGEEC